MAKENRNSKKGKWILPLLIAMLVILLAVPFLVFWKSSEKVKGDIRWNLSIPEVEESVKEKYPTAVITKTQDSLAVISGNDAEGLLWEDLECVRIWYGFNDVYGLEKIVVSMEESDTNDYDTLLQQLSDRFGEAEITDEGDFGKKAAWTTHNLNIVFESAGAGKTFKLDDEREAAYRLIYEEESHSLRDIAPR